MKLILLAVLVFASYLVVESSKNVPDHSHDTEHDLEVIRVRRGTYGKRTEGDCKYKKGPWGECDSENIQKKTFTLKKGESTCEQTKVITRKCKKVVCKYEKGDWSDCEVGTNTRIRTDTLKPKSDSTCEPTRTLSKKCKKVCKYSKQAQWSDCDSATGKKTKVLVLKSGNPHVCDESKKITKPCNKNSSYVSKNNKGKQEDYDDDK